ncbi:MAG: RluA family pseudouridine synthase [Chloroflexi bacterium]|nr:RluA family pseudouridine synthase [Chloroflexota bacterium]
MTEEGRLDTVLAAAYPDLSRARVQRLIANEHVLVDGAPARKSTYVHEGAEIAVTLPETTRDAAPSGLSLPVLYEDDHVLAIDKPAGLLVHDAPAEPCAPSVAAWFVEHYPSEAAAFDVERPGIVHRLDKHTSGVLLLAKTPPAQTALSAAFEARETHKQYLALCDGIPQRDRAVIDADIARSQADRRRMAVASDGRSAQTEYEVLAAARERSLVLAKPLTGRTHQIRVHLAAIGAPVAGDELYGRGPGPRHLLHAWRLTMPHPVGGELTVTAPLPRDMLAAIDDAGFAAQAAPYAEPVDPTRTEATA